MPRRNPRVRRDDAHAHGYTLESAARDEGWLADHRAGMPIQSIADRDGVDAAQVRLGIDRARAHRDGPDR